MEHKSRLEWAVEGLNFCLVLMINHTLIFMVVKGKVLPAHRVVPISVSVALSPTSVNAVKATAEGGWFTGNSVCLTFPLHSLMLSTR